MEDHRSLLVVVMIIGRQDQYKKEKNTIVTRLFLLKGLFQTSYSCCEKNVCLCVCTTLGELIIIFILFCPHRLKI
jgi:hypothetical protein